MKPLRAHRPIPTRSADTYVCQRCGIERPRSGRRTTGYCLDCLHVMGGPKAVGAQRDSRLGGRAFERDSWKNGGAQDRAAPAGNRGLTMTAADVIRGPRRG